MKYKTTTRGFLKQQEASINTDSYLPSNRNTRRKNGIKEPTAFFKLFIASANHLSELKSVITFLKKKGVKVVFKNTTLYDEFYKIKVLTFFEEEVTEDFPFVGIRSITRVSNNKVTVFIRIVKNKFTIEEVSISKDNRYSEAWASVFASSLGSKDKYIDIDCTSEELINLTNLTLTHGYRKT